MKLELLTAIYEAQGRACFVCDRYMDPPTARPTGKLEATRDHVIPRALNGSAGMGNILLAHRHCNLAKGARPPTDREMARIETTLRAMSPEVLRLVLDGAVNTLEAARSRVRNAMEEAKNAESAAMIVLRHCPTSDVVTTLERLSVSREPA